MKWHARVMFVTIIVSCLAALQSASSTTHPSRLITYVGAIDYSPTRVHRIVFENWKFSSTFYAEKANMYMNHFEQASRVPQLHQLNTSLVCLLYRNIRAVYERTSDEYNLFLANDWILKDAGGTRIKSTVFDYWIVDVGNSDYQRWVANWLKSYLDDYNYDGVFLDNCLPSTEIMWSTSPGPPINPRTGKAFTSEEFKEAVIGLVNRTKDTIGPRLVIGNGIFSGESFFASYRHQNYVDLLTQSEIDGIESEGWLSSVDSNQWYSEDKWLDSIEFVAWLENNFLNRGAVFLPVCQNAGPYDGQSVVLPSGCSKEQYALYCFSSLLLAANRSRAHYLNFGYYTDAYVDDLFKIELGTPLNSYYVVQGTHVYSRDFSRMKVLVNPTYQPYAATLNGQYETVDGQPISSPVTVDPHTGLLLVKS